MPYLLEMETGWSLGYAEVRTWPTPELVEAPVLTRAGRPDLKAYGSLVAAEPCAVEV